jgi:hypothetical protein
MQARTIAALAALLVIAGCDANQPGTSMDEVGAESAPEFSSIDANADGSLTPEEAQTNAQLSSMFAEADTDGDGRINRDEYDTAMKDAG